MAESAPDERRVSHCVPDRYGVPVVAPRGTASVRLLDAAVHDLVAFCGDPLRDAEAVLAADPGMALARCLRAYLHCSAERPQERAAALALLEPLARPGAGELPGREAGHVLAAAAWARGDLEGAAAALDRVLARWPRDLLALKVAQDLHLAMGDTTELRDVVRRVLGAWPAADPGGGLVRALLAFGLAECGDNRAAEQAARLALEDAPEDVAALHALVDVCENEGRPAEGAALLDVSAGRFESSFFAAHAWWHRTLFDLEFGDLEEALQRYDGRVVRATGDLLGLVGAASLLWRLHLLGVRDAVSERARDLAVQFAPMAGEATSCFLRWHAAMVFGLARRSDLASELTAPLASPRTPGALSHGALADEVGLEIVGATLDFAGGRYASCAQRLEAASPRAGALGGSRAERDVLVWTEIAAACASGDRERAASLVGARRSAKDSSAWLLERIVATWSPTGASSAASAGAPC